MDSDGSSSITFASRVSGRTAALMADMMAEENEYVSVRVAAKFIDLMLSVFSDWTDVGPASCLGDRSSKRFVATCVLRCMRKNGPRLFRFMDEQQMDTMGKLYAVFTYWESGLEEVRSLGGIGLCGNEIGNEIGNGIGNEIGAESSDDGAWIREAARDAEMFLAESE
jgi:hypothetical protein